MIKLIKESKDKSHFELSMASLFLLLVPFSYTGNEWPKLYRNFTLIPPLFLSYGLVKKDQSR